MTAQELKDLPVFEETKKITITSREMLAKYPGHKLGDVIHVHVMAPLSGIGISGDDIAIWADETGSWTPVFTPEGWAKMPFEI